MEAAMPNRYDPGGRPVLAEGETVVVAWAQDAAGPGWRNEPVWILVRTATGSLDERCLQPEQQSAAVRALFRVSSLVSADMRSAAERCMARAPQPVAPGR